MGQQLRRAVGKIKEVERSSPSPTSRVVVDRRSLPTEELSAAKSPSPSTAAVDVVSEKGRRTSEDNVLEERDPKYDTMLNQMVGRIRAKPGGKAEMGEASVVETSKRPLPKLRNTTPESTRYEENPVPQGTLNVAQVRHIMLLYQGKAQDHHGPMSVNQIAEKYRIDVSQVQKITQFLSLPTEVTDKQKKQYE
ncbi:NADH dehydrogenase [ubiquinone] 1 alpha subcomplex assembly factor 4 [Arabidopsis thaliana x Arabidopsis arenosa]|uniref:NADH dehydrogenase [ubiquinone] 1 alpha subcomplex assembly factor 4 n=1 Tax=Arabidopsis thaliana x Arabidopsis arenosa TaxID=1240361 RepID=A0A8T2AVG2_9BRAS|nr:NADH dehydrogenase [ubiquinone] 1 alpha subcomplex assembly factor 4 [Arabidopsis thaliana x Arabidopsis arenosa]